MATTAHEPQMGLTFEKVWAALMEDRERMQELRERMDKSWEQAEKGREQAEKGREQARIDREQREKRRDEVLARIDRISEKVAEDTWSLGELIETLIAAKLWEKFAADPYNFTFTQAYRRMPIYEEHNSYVLTDIDILLVNGEYVMVVEVKRELDALRDVDHHIKRMGLVLQHPPAQCKDKILLGAIAGGVVTPEARDYAHRAGFFVLELKGESVHLMNPPAGFAPREW